MQYAIVECIEKYLYIHVNMYVYANLFIFNCILMNSDAFANFCLYRSFSIDIGLTGPFTAESHISLYYRQ